MDARIFASALASDGVAAMNMRLVPTCATRCPPLVRLIWMPGKRRASSRIIFMTPPPEIQRMSAVLSEGSTHNPGYPAAAIRC